MITLLADECVHIDLIEALKKHDFPIVSVKELGLSGKSDEEVFEYACDHDFVVLTFDRGFGDIFRFDHSRSSGIVIVLLAQMTKSELLTIPIEFFKLQPLADLKGRLVIIRKTKIRISQRAGLKKLIR